MNESNPLELPPPPEDKPVERVKAFARDLAYGALHDYWGAIITVMMDRAVEHLASDLGSLGAIKSKWADERPSMNMLVAFGYAAIYDKSLQSQTRYSLTIRAFQLLEAPSVETRIFISYRRNESSAFALLLLSRMKTVGLDPFLDLSIDPGEEWHAHLEEEVKQCDYFVSVIGKDSLGSGFVREEIEWAVKYGKRIIPIWHNGFDPSAHSEFEELLSKNAIVVENENAKAYNNAVIDLLNYLGFTPI